MIPFHELLIYCGACLLIGLAFGICAGHYIWGRTYRYPLPGARRD